MHTENQTVKNMKSCSGYFRNMGLNRIHYCVVTCTQLERQVEVATLKVWGSEDVIQGRYKRPSKRWHGTNGHPGKFDSRHSTLTSLSHCIYNLLYFFYFDSTYTHCPTFAHALISTYSRRLEIDTTPCCI